MNGRDDRANQGSMYHANDARSYSYPSTTRAIPIEPYLVS